MTMRPTPRPQGSPTPNSSAVKRQRKAAAAPLGDVTNLLLPETPTPTKPRRAGIRRLPTPSLSSAAVSSTCSSTASVTPAPKPSSAAGDALEEERGVVKSPISTVYARRGTAAGTQGRRRRNPAAAAASNNKGKEQVAAAAGTSSCPPLGRATRKNSRIDPMAQDTRPISSSAPCHGAKKKPPPPSTSRLPEDFVKMQRAYFAEVDAFELPVEEVSESEVE